MMAFNVLTRKEELMNVDLAKCKPQKIRALINHAKQRFRMQGYSYPET
jgi:hypothetical protein